MSRSAFTDAIGVDFRAALADLRATPAGTALSVLVLAISIGLSSATFGVVRSFFKYGPAVPEANGLAYVHSSLAAERQALFLERLGTLAGDFATTRRISSAVAIGGIDVERVTGEVVSGNYATVLGIEGIRGRFPEGVEAAAGNTFAVVSERLASRLGGDRAGAIGKELKIDRRSFSIVAVVPVRFDGINDPMRPTDFWIPAAQYFDRARGGAGELAIVRMKAEEEIERLRAAVGTMETDLLESRERRARVVGATSAMFPWNPDLGPSALGGRPAALVGATALVLVLAVANLSGISLARRMARGANLRLRIALGATPERLRRQLLLESAVQTLAGAVIGVPAFQWAWKMLGDAVPGQFSSAPMYDALTFAIVTVVFIVVMLSTALLPGRQLFWKRGNVTVSSSEIGRIARLGLRSRRRILLPQVALSITLLGIAAVVESTLANEAELARTDRGPDPDNLVVLETRMRPAGRSSAAQKPPDRTVVYDSLGRALDGDRLGFPAALVAQVPSLGPSATALYHARSSFSGHRETGVPAHPNTVSGAYFEILGLRFLSGGAFRANLRATAPVAIVSQSVASQLWPGKEAIGQMVGSWRQNEAVSAIHWRTIVGVVEDAKDFVTGKALQTVYVPHDQEESGSFTILGRPTGSVDSGISAIRGAVSAEPQLEITRAQGLGALLDRQVMPLRQSVDLLGAIGLFGLALSGVGIFGAVNVTIQHRLRELATRVALGAGPFRVVLAIVKEAVPLFLGASLIAGVAIASVAAVLASKGRIGPAPIDPLGMVQPALMTLGVFVLASALPIIRILRLDTAQLLKE